MAKVSDVQKQLELMVEKGINQHVIGLEGGPGIGKSAIVKFVAKKLGIGCIDLRLSQMADASDFVGLPRTDANTLTTVYCKPDWWPEEGTKGILFLDEPNRGAPDVMQGVFQLLTDRRIHMNVLPKGWFIVMAMNPSEGNISFNVTQTDAAWNSRYIRLEVECDPEEWMAWARANEINDLVIRFIGVNHNLLHSVVEAKSFPCPRTWEMVSTFLNASAFLPELQADMIRGMVGMEAATTFIKFLDKNFSKPIGGKNVLDEFKTGTVERANKAGLMEKMKVYEAAALQQNDENHATIKDIVATIGSKASLTHAQYQNLAGYILVLKAELQIAILKKLPNPILGELGNQSKALHDVILKNVNELQKELGRK